MRLYQILLENDLKYKNIVATQLNSQGFNEIMANSLTTASYIELSNAERRTQCDNVEPVE
jgi:hypothetical protein